MDLEHLGCWAHARRKFVKAYDAGNMKAKPVIKNIAELYRIEKECKKLELSEVKEKRQKLHGALPVP